MFEFVNEPPARRGGSGRPRGGRWSEVAAAMRSNPGKWTMFAESVSTGYAGSLRRGTPDFPKGAFEFTTRALPGAKLANLWGRYIGESGEYKW